MIGDRWGVTDPETERRYPCDELVPEPAMEAWRGVTVRARPQEVWPWVAQIRLAPYSVMSYVLVEAGPSTRLLLKVVTRRRGPLTPLLCLGDLVMARRQLLNLAALAEGAATR